MSKYHWVGHSIPISLAAAELNELILHFYSKRLAQKEIMVKMIQGLIVIISTDFVCLNDQNRDIIQHPSHGICNPPSHIRNTRLNKHDKGKGKH